MKLIDRVQLVLGQTYDTWVFDAYVDVLSKQSLESPILTVKEDVLITAVNCSPK